MCISTIVTIFLTDSRSLYTKEQEFRAWLVEERMINPETITKDQTKKEFAKFVEDYNTGSFSLSFSVDLLTLTSP